MDKPFIVLATPVLLQGGTEYQMLSVVRALKGIGSRIGIICYFESNPTIVELFKSEGAEVFLMNLQRKQNKGLSGLLSLLFQLISWLRKNKPEVFHVQYLAPGLIPILAARIARIRKVIATIHISGTPPYGIKAKFLFKIASGLVDHFICVSQGTENFWFGNSHLLTNKTNLKNCKHFTIYNCIDTDQIQSIVSKSKPEEVNNKYHIPSNTFVLGIVGRLSNQKGHADLFQAVAQLQKRRFNFILIVIGTGNQERNLKNLAISLGIDKQILWLGSLPQKEVFSLLSIMDLFVMPSHYEGFGLAAAEAMAAGVPVIASDVDGLREVVQDGISGMLVPSEKPDALFQAISNLIDDLPKRMTFIDNGRTLVIARFSFESFKEKVVQLYSMVLGNNLPEDKSKG